MNKKLIFVYFHVTKFSVKPLRNCKELKTSFFDYEKGIFRFFKFLISTFLDFFIFCSGKKKIN